MSIRGLICFCSNEMQLRRIWRAKQKGGFIDDNVDNIPLESTPSSGTGTNISTIKAIYLTTTLTTFPQGNNTPPRQGEMI